MARNRRRDAEVNEALEAAGWTVVRLWEHDIKHDLPGCLERLLSAIGRTDTASL